MMPNHLRVFPVDAWHIDVDDVDATGDGDVAFVLEVPVTVSQRIGFGELTHQVPCRL